jgi:hypothetical protein
LPRILAFPCLTSDKPLISLVVSEFPWLGQLTMSFFLFKTSWTIFHILIQRIRIHGHSFGAVNSTPRASSMNISSDSSILRERLPGFGILSVPWELSSLPGCFLLIDWIQETSWKEEMKLRML